MAEKFEGGIPSQEHGKESERAEGSKVWNKLADAFGGYSQVPDYVIGMAIAGQINNGGLSIEDATNELDRVVEQICERWEDQDPQPDAGKIREEIIRGMKEEAKNWPKENEVWAFIDATEKRK